MRLSIACIKGGHGGEDVITYIQNQAPRVLASEMIDVDGVVYKREDNPSQISGNEGTSRDNKAGHLLLIYVCLRFVGLLHCHATRILERMLIESDDGSCPLREQ